MSVAQTGATAICTILMRGLLASQPQSHASLAPRPDNVSAILESFSDGDVAGGSTLVATSARSVASFSGELKRAASIWVQAGTDTDQTRRRIVVATVALDAAQHLSIRVPVSRVPHSGAEAQWRDRRDLVEWACAFLRAGGPPSPGERWWHLAATAFLEDSAFFPFFAYEHPLVHPSHIDDVHAHVAHGKSRFPDETRFDLADALIDERALGIYYVSPIADGLSIGWQAHVREDGAPSVHARLLPDSGQRVSHPSAWEFRFIEAAVQRLSSLLTDPAVGLEAHLRLGVIEFNIDQAELALPHLELARRSPERFMAYLAAFFKGAALVKLDRFTEAEVAFRDALTLVPGAQSATVALGWTLLVHQRHDDAAAVVRTALESPVRAADPYALFTHGDARLLPVFLAELHAAIRK